MKIRYLFGLAIVFGVISIVALRYNAQHIYDLKTQIIQKDNAGEPVTEDLQSLRRFIFAHMNTTTKLELSGSYQRALDSAQAPGGGVYAEAQAACDKQGVSSVAQAQCVQSYLATRVQPGSESIVDKTPYIYSFASPGWSPDAAGFSLLLAIGCALGSLLLYVIRLFKSRPEATL